MTFTRSRVRCPSAPPNPATTWQDDLSGPAPLYLCCAYSGGTLGGGRCGVTLTVAERARLPIRNSPFQVLLWKHVMPLRPEVREDLGSFKAHPMRMLIPVQRLIVVDEGRAGSGRSGCRRSHA